MVFSNIALLMLLPNANTNNFKDGGILLRLSYAEHDENASENELDLVSYTMNANTYVSSALVLSRHVFSQVSLCCRPARCYGSFTRNAAMFVARRKLAR